MIPTKTQTIRVNPDVHHLAKKAAVEKLMTLQVWVEELIKRECKEKK